MGTERVTKHEQVLIGSDFPVIHPVRTQQSEKNTKWEPQQSEYCPRNNLFLSESGISREEVNQALIMSDRFGKKCLVTLHVWMTEMERWCQHSIFWWLLFTQFPTDTWGWCIRMTPKLKADREWWALEAAQAQRKPLAPKCGRRKSA